MKKGKKYSLAILALAGLYSLGGCAYSTEGATLPVKVESQKEVSSFDLEDYVDSLLNDNETTVNYESSDYRFLVYLYTMALSNTSFDTLKTESDNDGFAFALTNNVDKEFIKNYMNDGTFDFDKVYAAILTMESDIDYIKVSQEANICLRHDLYLNNTDGVTYNDFLMQFRVNLKDDELFDEWYPYHEENISMYEDGRLFEKVIALK